MPSSLSFREYLIFLLPCPLASTEPNCVVYNRSCEAREFSEHFDLVIVKAMVHIAEKAQPVMKG